MASFHGHMDMVQWFLKVPRMGQALAGYVDHRNVDGNTSISLAARKGHVEVKTPIEC
jgi:ankyrin repeat protein